MNHVKALIMKFLMIAVVLLIILTGFFDVEFVDTLLISAALTVVAYALGDLMIFRNVGNRANRTGANNASSDHAKRNAIATISDIAVAFLVIWLMGEALLADTQNLITAAIISAVVIGAGEWFFHKYLDRSVFPEKQNRTTTSH